jgi:uncharacterized protein (TIGR00299 family) protein
MKHAHFDLSSGIAGDMLLGALVDAGGDFKGLERALLTLPVEGWRLERERVERCWLVGTKVRVVMEREEKKHRHLPEIEKHIAASGLSGRAKRIATAAFRRLAEAEAKVHGIAVEKVHFHEVGAVDAIVDLCGAAHLIDQMGLTSFSVSPVNVGSGTVKCDHGIMPVPAPATAELLRGLPTYSDGPAVELTTPTGAAFLCALEATFGAQPVMSVTAIGNGAGDMDFPDRANFVRVCVGEIGNIALPVECESLLLLTAEIDDMSPELLAPIIARAMDAGALDATLEPVQMKKGRLGHRVTTLVEPERRDAVVERIFRETTTLGIKIIPVERLALRRRMDEIETPWGIVRVKIAQWGDEPLRAVPEYEDCRLVAAEAEVTLAEVHAAAQARALEHFLRENTPIV